MYARVVCVQVQPGKLEQLVQFYQDSVLPAACREAGFNGLYLLTSRALDKSVSVALWETKADMKAFDNDYMPALAAQSVTLFAEPPIVEVYEVTLPVEARPMHHEIAFSEMSLGLRVEDPFDGELSSRHAVA
ncbi:MAG TPA: hypothetical protein VF177_15540 [Anaerolineae bacterium]